MSRVRSAIVATGCALILLVSIMYGARYCNRLMQQWRRAEAHAKGYAFSEMRVLFLALNRLALENPSVFKKIATASPLLTSSPFEEQIRGYITPTDDLIATYQKKYASTGVVDPWGTWFRIKINPSGTTNLNQAEFETYRVQILSDGPNRRGEGGDGDDLVSQTGRIDLPSQVYGQR